MTETQYYSIPVQRVPLMGIGFFIVYFFMIFINLYLWNITSVISLMLLVVAQALVFLITLSI